MLRILKVNHAMMLIAHCSLSIAALHYVVNSFTPHCALAKINVIIQYIKVTVQIAPIIRQFKAQNVSLHV